VRAKRFGVVDVGSNTIRSLVVEVRADGSSRVLDDEREVARLASGLDGHGRLSGGAMRRAIAALRRMAAITRGRGVRRISAVATSAIRNARNRKAFVDRVRSETGLRLRVISGAEEARLAFESAARSFDLGERPVVVADVGGGSTEAILALGHHIQQIHSLRLGAVSLTERYGRSDPWKSGEIRALRRAVRRTLREARIEADPSPLEMIASGGTATAVAQMIMARQGLLNRPVQGFEMTQAELLHLRNALQRRSLRERRRMPGLSPDRADIILAGVVILYEILSHLRVNVLKVSAHGIRHALLQRMLARLGSRGGPPRTPRRVEAAEALARSLHFEESHGLHVRTLALSLFDQLAEPLGLDGGGRDLLAAAAILHDVGYVVGYRRHHKHAYRLIAHAQIDGFTPREREIIALTARYHRRSPPTKRHRAFAALVREDRRLVRRLGALLRIADALDRRHSQGVREIRARVKHGRVEFTLASRRDLGVELHALDAKEAFLRKLFHRKIVWRVVRRLPAQRAAIASVSGARSSSRRPPRGPGASSASAATDRWRTG
jgi:exopolyphosphatase/guanosine-5'-triphosphate,3'-diphosphate pyrophosphatase